MGRGLRRVGLLRWVALQFDGQSFLRLVLALIINIVRLGVKVSRQGFFLLFTNELFESIIRFLSLLFFEVVPIVLGADTRPLLTN